MTNRVCHFFNINKRTNFFQFFNNGFASFKAIHASKFTSKVVHRTVIIHDINLRKIVTLANKEVVRIMGWSDFNHTSTKFWVSVFITNDWNRFIDNWQDNIFANQVFVARIFWIDSDSRISKHSFRTSCCHLKSA